MEREVVVAVLGGCLEDDGLGHWTANAENLREVLRLLPEV